MEEIRQSEAYPLWGAPHQPVDSAGETIEFMLSPISDLIAAKLFLKAAIIRGGPPPRVINVEPTVRIQRNCRVDGESA